MGGYHGALDKRERHEMFWAWRFHGVMAVAGGWLEQPEWWRKDMAIMRVVYNVLRLKIAEEIRRRDGK